MHNKDNGGPAFPIPGLQDDADFNGMTLRDYFAAKAMQAIMLSNKDADADDLLKAIGEASYEYADAMLEARK